MAKHKTIFKRLAYTLTAYCYGSKSVTQPDVPLGQNIVLNKSYTQKKLGQISILEHNCLARFRNFKSTRNKNNKFLKYKISICLDHTFTYIVLRVPYTFNFI